MGMTIKDKLHQIVDRLTDEDAAETLTFAQQLLGEAARQVAPAIPIIVTPGDQAAARRRVLAEGRPPLDIASLAASNWLDGEDLDEMIAAIERWRREGGYV